MSDLEGATSPGLHNAYPSSPGEFASRWNSWPESKRGEWLIQAIQQSQKADRFDRLNLEMPGDKP